MLKGMGGFSENLKALANIANSLKVDKAITDADIRSTTDMMEGYKKTIDAINKEIEKTDDIELKQDLYKQRSHVLDSMEREKKEQRYYNDNREKNNSGNMKLFLGVAIGGTLGWGATKFIENKNK